MPATVHNLSVATRDQLDAAIQGYIAQGYVISNRTETSVTLFKKKEFNVVWAIVGFFACLLPLLIYTIVYAAESDKMVIVSVEGSASSVIWSDDKRLWWTGQTWRNVSDELPAGVPVSDDGRLFWDGASWRPVKEPQQLGETTSGEPGTRLTEPLDEPDGTQGERGD